MNIIFLIILFPLISFLFLSFTQGEILEKNATKIGIFSIFISFIITLFYALTFMYDPSNIIRQKLWNWAFINELKINFDLILDGLSLSMLLIITGIGLLIHIFSSWYMKKKKGYSRFFAYTNLFISSMSLLVLADNFIFMYLGWEGVSVCSYLLINFYYKNTKNNLCAFKAFILTRISDIFLIIAFFMAYKIYGTFNFEEIHFLSSFLKINNSFNLNILTLFLLIGVLGKSAQLPLHTWLSDAMVGPAPVSALIHAATMVTAGVYLIARTHFLFLLTPNILYTISIIGIITVCLSSLSALVQTDIKRILAYSTMSQIGYMFLALGCQAWIAAITHLIIHAFFKALLFLSSGSLIFSCNNQKNIFKMSSLSPQSPILYFSFLIGGASLISFPLITSGFYSKGNILFNVLQNGYNNLFLIGLIGSFLTSIYTFRMIFIVFKLRNTLNIKDVCNLFSKKKLSHDFPLLILMILSSIIGIYLLPPLIHLFPLSPKSQDGKFIFEIISSLISFSGIFLSYYFWVICPPWMDKVYQFKFVKLIRLCLLNGWYIDVFYKIFFVNFYLYVSRILFRNPFNYFCKIFVYLIKNFNFILLKTVNGNLKYYIFSMLLGITLIFMIILLL
ncbi:NADH-quinone oxidoreductase subunit L [Buchnera aphidicola (Melanaphis sacchari)]|uniref:NADH-quinone oxidoreductase subunit L n=1 Tax=Buchnera aphidicola (Melanaphis sacchari) TaxID=2173854 RepID=A0A2U8DH77_9GAMM|nr:NADH-quinone oxidoreductase subunit L [Buchnera aphidicola]AWH90602.1 NADH-quinone oxidoreductase subunit L [Buchnera aphidicola (Melanaphis sacchari)]